MTGQVGPGVWWSGSFWKETQEMAFKEGLSPHRAKASWG
jgi:hypothetical protein